MRREKIQRGDLMRAIGKTIELLRCEKDRSIRQVCKEVFLTQDQWFRIEQGQEDLTVWDLIQVSVGLEVPVTWFFPSTITPATAELLVLIEEDRARLAEAAAALDGAVSSYLHTAGLVADCFDQVLKEIGVLEEDTPAEVKQKLAKKKGGGDLPPEKNHQPH